MGCFKGSKYKTEAVSPEQEQMYKMMASIMQGGAQNYQSKPMWSVGADPGQLASQDFLQRQLGYGGYQQPGFYTAGSQNVQNPQYQDPRMVAKNKLQAPWQRG